MSKQLKTMTKTKFLKIGLSITFLTYKRFQVNRTIQFTTLRATRYERTDGLILNTAMPRF